VSAPPLIVLGVRRSGTTLLRVVLDRHSQLAIPDESYFVPQLAGRHGDRIDVDPFVDDLRRLPTLRDWEVSVEGVRARLRPGMTLGQAIAAVYEQYAADRGKSRWGDKTPMYMQHLPLLERLFPDARYVHLIRDGRDAAVSFLAMPEGIVTKTWAHPKTAADFACEWRTQVRSAQALGRRAGTGRYLEVRYEAFVADPAAELERICSFAALPFEPAMLDYVGRTDVSAKPHQRSLERPPTPGLRDWRTEFGPGDVAAFEDVAGDVLGELGYELSGDGRATIPARARRLAYRARVAAWLSASAALRRSPAWKRRHPPLA
jgi:sulfotransferase family protein